MHGVSKKNGFCLSKTLEMKHGLIASRWDNPP
jgi:hypothetical protein